MKVAICLYGIVGGTDGKDGAGKTVPFEECYKTYKNHIIDINNADVFIHSWSVEVEEELINLYKPKKYIFQPQKSFNKERKRFTVKPDAAYRSLSKWYSFGQVSKLRQDYEFENNFKYDWVMFSRFDTLFFVDMDFSTYEPNHLYVPNWNTPQGLPGRPHIKADKVNRSLDRDGFSDMWYLADSKIADDFMDIYDGVVKNKYSVAQHKAAWDCLMSKNYSKNDFRYVLYRHFDFELYRWHILRNFYSKGDGKI